MIASKGFRNGEILLWSVIVLDIIKVARIVIAVQVRYDRRDACNMTLYFSLTNKKMDRTKCVTISDGVEGPLIVDKESVKTNLIHASATKSLRPVG